jgi:hypothetical protein
LERPELLMRVSCRHVQRFTNFEAPRSSLDWLVAWHLGEETMQEHC